jgi:hypothetical protein
MEGFPAITAEMIPALLMAVVLMVLFAELLEGVVFGEVMCRFILTIVFVAITAAGIAMYKVGDPWGGLPLVIIGGGATVVALSTWR